MSKERDEEIKEIEKQIIIERLRQAPANMKISFGMSDGKFLDRDELIHQVVEDTIIGQKIVKVQMAYLKALKNNLVVEG
ncbi:MAG: hypothetical protein AABX11_02125 [Nanoarchaeota archaeon]